MLLRDDMASNVEKLQIADIRAALTPELLNSFGYSIETHPDIIGDLRILRCLRAFPEENPKTRFLDSLVMRKRLKLDEIREKALEIIAQKGVFGWDVEDTAVGSQIRRYIPDMCLNAGVTPSGAPLFSQMLGTSNYDGFFSEFGNSTYITFLMYFLELRQIQLNCISKTAYLRQVAIFIVGTNMQFLSRKSREFLRSQEAKDLFSCYQEFTSVNYILDSPWIFRAAYNSIRPVLPQRVQAKVVFSSKEELMNGDMLSQELRKWFGFEPSPEKSDDFSDPSGCTRKFWEEVQFHPESLSHVRAAVNVPRVALLLFNRNLIESARRVLKDSVLDVSFATPDKLKTGCQELIFLENILLRKPFTLDKLVSARRFLDNFLKTWKEEPEVSKIDLDSPSVNNSCAVPFTMPSFLSKWTWEHPSSK